jgi:hypothetical protein
VDSVSFDRTIIRYETPDGIVHSPATGVLYPAGLAAGDLVRVEYDVSNPELARVAGRSAIFTLEPLATTVLVTWLLAVLLCWWLGRRGGLKSRRVNESPENPTENPTDLASEKQLAEKSD